MSYMEVVDLDVDDGRCPYCGSASGEECDYECPVRDDPSMDEYDGVQP